MAISTILIIIALICFILAAFGVAVPRTSLGWLGMAFVTLSWLISGGGVGSELKRAILGTLRLRQPDTRNFRDRAGNLFPGRGIGPYGLFSEWHFLSDPESC